MITTEFYRRRQALLGRMEPESVAIIPASSPVKRNKDVDYPYRPDSNFYYLTGFTEPNAVAVLSSQYTQGEYILFCQKRNKEKERWTGPTVGPVGAMRNYGANKAFPIEELDKLVPKLLEKSKKLYYALGCDVKFDQRVVEWLNNIRLQVRTGIRGPEGINLLDQYLHQMRLVKHAEELATMRKAAMISAKAHQHLMQTCHPGMPEYVLEAKFIHECTLQGANRQAYSPIVGGGVNGCTLHYDANQDILQDGDLVLVDAGCEYGYYASDITRTFPVNG
ncbi:Xaa-Pro aminopeptidase, partial [Achromatium sp. WMS1]